MYKSKDVTVLFRLMYREMIGNVLLLANDHMKYCIDEFKIGMMIRDWFDANDLTCH